MMTTKRQIIKKILAQHSQKNEPQGVGSAFAPSNIALCKYWGKRNTELNLPLTPSLSISLADKGAKTTITESDHEEIFFNGQLMPQNHPFSKRASAFLDLFRPHSKINYCVKTELNIPVAAGLASSACGLAALVLALNQLYGWELDHAYLSIFARIGSGSASRSLWHGFVEWREGESQDGLDSFAESIPTIWPEFRIGLHILHTQQKSLSSREAMERTVKTSLLYKMWPEQVHQDIKILKGAIAQQDFTALGHTAEHNALSMHATMMSSWPPIIYHRPETLIAMQQVWNLRAQGIPVYFTQDAGPNLKLLFLVENEAAILKSFPNLDIIAPFHCQPNINLSSKVML